MKEKLKRTIFFLVTFLFVFNFFTINSAFAIVRPDEVDVAGSVEGAEKIKEFGGNILAIILAIGVVLSIIVLIIIGIKYMFGTIEDKAKYKTVLLPYTIGMFLLFAAIPITNVLFDFSGALVDNSNSAQPNPEEPEKKQEIDYIKVCIACENEAIELGQCRDMQRHIEEEKIVKGVKCKKCGHVNQGVNLYPHNCKTAEPEDPEKPEIEYIRVCIACNKDGIEINKCEETQKHFEEGKYVKGVKCNKCGYTNKGVKLYSHACHK